MNINKQINGITNCIRLEGIANNIPKIIYLFIYPYIFSGDDTQCPNIYAHDIKDFFVEEFANITNSNKYYDFFFLTTIYNTIYKPDNRKGNYTDSILNSFVGEIEFDKKKIVKSKNFPNTRFHYGDLSEYINGVLSNELSFISNFNYYSLYSKRKHRLIDELNNNLSHINKFVNSIYDILIKKNTKSIKKISLVDFKKKTMTEQSNDYLLYVTSKIISDYKHNTTKDIMNNIFDNYKTFDQLNSIYDTLIKLFDYFKNNEFSDSKNHDIICEIDINMYKYTSIFCTISRDLSCFYCLRRILDKDYVTNGILYMPYYESCYLIMTLSKLFNFKITHTAYNRHLNNINEIIKNENIKEISNVIIPDNLLQCTDVTYFPPFFN